MKFYVEFVPSEDGTLVALENEVNELLDEVVGEVINVSLAFKPDGKPVATIFYKK